LSALKMQDWKMTDPQWNNVDFSLRWRFNDFQAGRCMGSRMGFFKVHVWLHILVVIRDHCSKLLSFLKNRVFVRILTTDKRMNSIIYHTWTVPEQTKDNTVSLGLRDVTW